MKGLSRTFDHVKGKNVKDFANLLIGWSDGLNIFPVISALVSSKREKLVIQDFDKKVDKRKSGGRRRVDSKNRKTTLFYATANLSSIQVSRLNMLLWTPGSIQAILLMSFWSLVYTVSA